VKPGRPKSDPEKVAAWKQRSRAPLARSNLRSNGKRDVKNPLDEITRPSIAKQMMQPPPPVEELTMRKALQVGFSARTPASEHACAWRCGRTATTWHHWLSQRKIRDAAMVWARRVSATPRETQDRLRDLLRDERNLSPFCVWCHLSNDPGANGHGFLASHVPASAHEFAAELGPEWAERLKAAYPDD
jgi:hypothetical protein